MSQQIERHNRLATGVLKRKSRENSPDEQMEGGECACTDLENCGSQFETDSGTIVEGGTGSVEDDQIQNTEANT